MKVVNYSITGSGNRRVFKIPVGGLSRTEAEKVLRGLISQYQSPYGTWNTGTGEFKFKPDPWFVKVYNYIFK